jgi:hypothetical protein
MNWESFCRNADRLLFRHLIAHHQHLQGRGMMSQATLTAFSPIYDIISNPVPVSIAITTQPTA